MIANRLNVRPVKVKLPPGANHAYVTFRYSVTLFVKQFIVEKQVTVHITIDYSSSICLKSI